MRRGITSAVVLAMLGLAAVFTAAAEERPLAFPGAEGYGRFASGGRGGSVIAVTNLDDAGPGSLRAAIEATGPRTIVFRVAGTIFLETPLVVREGDLTIAGQTAPGDGICIANRGLVVAANNVIVRFIRSRLGDLHPRQKGLKYFGSDAFEARFVENVIIDHCSFSWGIDEVASPYQNRNFTLQWSIISEALHNSFHDKGNHGFGGIWGGTGVSFHHNLIAHNRSRNPRFNGARYGGYEEWGDGKVDFRNNVIYNWSSNSVYGAEPHSDGFQASYNLIANYYRPGPATPGHVAHRIIDVGTRGGHVSRFYVAGNHIDGSPEVTADNWKGVDRVPEGLEAQARADAEFSMAPVQTDSAEKAFAAVLAHAGASLPNRDPVDRRLIEEVRNGTAPHGNNGLIDSQDDVGGFPELATGEAPVDSDGDGMPDAWELARGLDPEDPEDGSADPDGDGYTNLEDYLNELAAALADPRFGAVGDPQK